MFDISVIGSTVESARTLDEAFAKAIEISESEMFRGRLVRVHGVDGWEVVAEYRNGVREEFVAL